MTDPLDQKIGFLKGVAGFLRLTLSPEKLGSCEKHRVEHTGKICYLSLIDLALFRLTGDQEAKAEALEVALRVASKLGRDPRSGASIFWPGALDHRNAANHAIDSGAAVDCLASVMLEWGGALDAGMRARLEEAVRACAFSYLRDAARVKAIPAQRLWAATGLASAYALLKEDALKEAAVESLTLLLRDGLPDGGIPYFPNAVESKVHAGQEDITSYYHSRSVGFAFHILDRLGMKPWPKLETFLESALDLLLALYGSDGLKPLQNEAKQWYWESPYEVASHSFDVHALIMGHRHFGREDFLAAARASFHQLDRHRPEDGGIDSHRGKGFNFQCRLFWNGHAAWVARVIEDIPVSEAPANAGRPKQKIFPESGMVEVREAEYAALLRGAKKPVNVSYGSEVGGGCLLYFGKREDGFSNAIDLPKWPRLVPGSFLVQPARRPSLSERIRLFRQENKEEIRFRLYIAKMEFLGGRPGFALRYPFRHLVAKFFSEMGAFYASHWDCHASIHREGNRVRFTGAPARRSGIRFEGMMEEKEYCFEKDRIHVKDRLVIDQGTRNIVYGLSPVFEDFSANLEGKVRLLKDRAVFHPTALPATLEVRYILRA